MTSRNQTERPIVLASRSPRPAFCQSGRRACVTGLLTTLGLTACLNARPLTGPHAVLIVGPPEPPARAPLVAAPGVTPAQPQATPQPPAPSASPLPVPARPVGGAGGSVPDGPVTLGSVRAQEGAEIRALAGATIMTTDGRSVRSDADGRFRLPGLPPDDGVYMATAPGFSASTIAGYHDAAPVLHLQPLVTTVVTSGQAALAPLRVSGRCVSPDGSPQAGILVVLGNGAGLSATPATTQADGRFELSLNLPGGQMTQGTLLAIDTQGRWAAFLSGLALTGPIDVLDGDANAPGDNDVVLQATTHTLRLQVDRQGLPAPVYASVAMVAPDGTSLSLFEEPRRATIAPLPGVRYTLLVEANDQGNQYRSTIFRPNLAIDWAQSQTSLVEQLLPAPDWQSTPRLQAGERLAWQRVPGATGYRLDIRGRADSAAFAWEGFTTETSLPWLAPDLPAAGEFDVVLTALDAPALSPRALAQLRHLRVPAGDPGYRKSSRQLRLRLP